MDAIGRQSDLLFPNVRRLVVVEVNRDPQALRVEAETAFFKAASQKSPRMGDCAFLEVLPEGKITGHLEEGVVAGGDAYFFDVQGTDTFLNACGGAVRERRVLLAEEVGLERHHAGVDEQKVRVVKDEGGTGDLLVSSLNEVLDKAFPDLMGLHGE